MESTPQIKNKGFQLDRRIVYLFVAVALAVPLWFGYSLRPARMETAEMFYKAIEDMKTDSKQIVLISIDWGPQGKAENEPQTEVAIEHLMRRRIPFALISLYLYAPPFMKELPKRVAEKLAKEIPGEEWKYGTDWVNLGYRPNSSIMIQRLATSEDLRETLKADSYGTPLKNLPIMQNVKTIKDISTLMQFTSLVGTFSAWIQFFQSNDYRPSVLHGCTSITIPEAHIYLDSGQMLGLHEGIAGAAWYDTLLSANFPKRVQSVAIRNNTSVAVAQMLVLLLIVLGNIAGYFTKSANVVSSPQKSEAG